MNFVESVDYYMCDELLTADERSLRDRVRRWVRDRYLPRAADCFEHSTFPLDLIPELAQLGLLGIELKGYGGSGLNDTSYGVACRELEWADSGLRSFVSVTNSLVMKSIAWYGSDEQKDKWLPQLLKGEKVGCFGLTEPDSGSDPSSMKSFARRSTGGYKLDGSKMWITNGEIADVAVVWAKTEKGIRGFLVEKGMPGFSARPVPRRFAQRASVTSLLTFKDVVLPKENLLPGTDGLKSALSCINDGRFGIAWGAIGAAASCYETALAYARERIQFGSPLARYQLIQRKLVKMLTEITKAQLLCMRLGRLKEQGRASAAQVSLAKRNNAAEALKIARTARDILGARGISAHYPVVRHLLNLEAVNTYEGTRDMHTLIVGKAITGHSAFKAGK